MLIGPAVAMPAELVTACKLPPHSGLLRMIFRVYASQGKMFAARASFDVVARENEVRGPRVNVPCGLLAFLRVLTPCYRLYSD